MKPGSIIFNPILRLKIRFGFHLRVKDLSLRAVAKHQITCCMGYSLIRKVHCSDKSYVGKQPLAWKEYSAEYCLKELQESKDWCT